VNCRGKRCWLGAIRLPGLVTGIFREIHRSCGFPWMARKKMGVRRGVPVEGFTLNIFYHSRM